MSTPAAAAAAAAAAPSPFQSANKRLLYWTLGALAVITLVVIIVAIVWNVLRVKRHAAHPETVVPVIMHNNNRHAAATVPETRVSAAQLPPGVKRVTLANFPTIDRFDNLPSGGDPAALAAAMVGLPQGNAEPPVPLPVRDVHVGYLQHRPDKRLPHQRLASVVFFEDHGGGIEFPYFGYTVRGARKRAVAWYNVSPTGTVDPRTQFRALDGTRATIVHIRDLPP